MTKCFSAWSLLLSLATTGALGAGGTSWERLALDTLSEGRLTFEGPVGDRLRANVEHWLLSAPQANPGMIEMFRVRDREPVPQLVPWAGEFVGKYLISAVQALRMSEDPRLRAQVQQVVAALIETQAEDGYLGPFPRKARLLGNWDLWGHYHAIQALLAWHQFEHGQDSTALAAARKAADLVCATYLDTGRRVFDAGDPEMNMAILTGMAMLYRQTGEPRYLRMAREVEKDWERAGDYLRAGLDGREFFQSPRPRWESLHDLQGLMELWQITGEVKYRDAFEHHWRSIRRWDQRNTGGFSSGEQATGNPFADTPIETCCTVAWIALTIDYLKLTGDARAADDLELATLNAGLGAQHPTGRWWTYNTPMNGAREASAHTIVFQSRAGTPELNCCSVNGPRVLGMLSEWAIMRAPDGLAVNWLGAGRFAGRFLNEAQVAITSTHDAWRDGFTELQVETACQEPFSLRVRVPAWAARTEARLNGEVVATARAGNYLVLNRRWASADRLKLVFDSVLRAVPGANEAAGRVSLYRGPLLLAYDQAVNPFDESAIPPVDLARLSEAQIEASPSSASAAMDAHQELRPWLVLAVPAVGSKTVRLVDFATAGAHGTRYRTWLPAQPVLPIPAFTQLPPDGGRIPFAPVRFQWRGTRGRTQVSHYCMEVATNDTFTPVVWSTNSPGQRLVLDAGVALRAVMHAQPDATSVRGPFYWRVITVAGAGQTLAEVPPARFFLDPGAKPQVFPPELVPGPKKEIVLHSLRNEAPPQFGRAKTLGFLARNADGTEVDGAGQMLRYTFDEWPEEDFTVAVRARVRALPQGRVGQVFSAWAAGMDDPLRIVVDGGRLFARVEAGAFFSTPGTSILGDRWYAIVAVKRGGQLMLHLDGKLAGSCAVPEYLQTRATECALGGNPNYGGNEFLAARFADFGFYARAWDDAEIRHWSATP